MDACLRETFLLLAFSLVMGSLFSRTFVQLLETWCEERSPSRGGRRRPTRLR
ncbi:MAG: hypothetical protein WA705_23910 [Candidatus Ozemobacteraceae bacterium]